MKNIITTILLLVATTSIFAGGPWPQKKGKGYFKLSEWWVVFDQHYTDAGRIDPNITTGVFNTSLYGEYGITDRLTAIINAPLISRNYNNNLVSLTTNEVLIQGESINTIGDIDLSFKYGLTSHSNFPISISLLLGLPTGTTGGGTLGNLQTGDGEFNQMIQLDAGSGFKIGKTNAYISSYLGFNNRTREFSEEVRYGVEVGAGLFNSKLWLVGKLNVIESLKNGSTAESVTSTSLFANNSEFSSLAIEANYYITDKVGISVSAAGAIRGEIIAAAPSYSFGVFYDMNK